MNELLLNVVDNMEVQSKKQFELLRELLTSVTPSMISELDDLLEDYESDKSLEEILFDLCEQHFNVHIMDMKTRNRGRSIVDARTMYMSFIYFCDNKKTLKGIGEVFGVDHATVIHAVKKFCTLYNADNQWRITANDFFDTLQKYGYNCKTTKQELKDGFEYFELKGGIFRGSYNLARKTIEEQRIETLIFRMSAP